MIAAQVVIWRSWDRALRWAPCQQPHGRLQPRSVSGSGVQARMIFKAPRGHRPTQASDSNFQSATMTKNCRSGVHTADYSSRDSLPLGQACEAGPGPGLEVTGYLCLCDSPSALCLASLIASPDSSQAKLLTPLSSRPRWPRFSSSLASPWTGSEVGSPRHVGS